MASARLDNRLLGQFHAALDWWLDELRDLLRQALLFRRMQPVRLEVTADDEPLPTGDAADRIGRGRRNVSLQLDDNRFLYRKIKLPRAAGKNIERVIGYEFNKYFPMQAADALFACRVVPAGADSSSVEVEIWAVSRRQIDLYLALIRRNLGIEVLTLYLGDSSGKTRITHDLERERRRQTDPGNLRYGRLLNLLLAALAAALLAYPVMKMDAYLEAQRDEVSRLEKRARPVIELRERIMALDHRFQALVYRKTAYPARADVWSYVTRVVANQATLQRLTIDGNRIHLTGQTPSVERLLRRLETEARIQEVKISGQVKPTKDNRFEVLNLSLEIRE
jgi:general secretion pathway protein L